MDNAEVLDLLRKDSRVVGIIKELKSADTSALFYVQNDPLFDTDGNICILVVSNTLTYDSMELLIRRVIPNYDFDMLDYSRNAVQVTLFPDNVTNSNTVVCINEV